MTLKALLLCLVVSSAGVCAHRRHTHTHTNTQNVNVECQDPSAPCVVTPSGAIRGSWMKTRRERAFQAFRGIRYAEPPVGELRFQPPKLVLKYEGEVDAREEGPACPMPEREGRYLDEDCLRVNVYTPGVNRSQPLPVIVFIHPGGFYSFSGGSNVAGPHYLLDRDLVLVTMNYRLASLGFLSTGDAHAPGNNGFKDQVAALRWVQRNIAAFGGNPDLVTISGCSAGARSVMLHMISPMSKGLFHRAISMSGSPATKVPSPHHLRHLAVKQAQLVGCPTNSTEAIYNCLKTVPWQDLGNSLPGFFEFGFDPVLIWAPVVELDFGQERFLPVEPMDAIREGKMHPVPYIISQTRDEFFWKAPYVLTNDTLRTTMDREWARVAPISFSLPRDAPSTPAAARRLREAYLGDGPLVNDARVSSGLGKLYGDGITAFSVHRLANLMCRHSSQPVYYYEFSYIGNHSHYEDPGTNKPTGVAHMDDLIYLFTLSYRFPTIPLDSPDNIMVERMTAIFYNFALHGDPNHPGPPELASLRWPAMTPQRRSYLRVGDSFSVHQNLFEDRFQVWEELYPIQY